MIDTLAKKLGNVTYDESYNDYFVACDDPTLGNLEFTFGKFKVVMEPGDYLEAQGVSKICINLKHFSAICYYFNSHHFLSIILASMLSKYASPE